MRSPLPPLRPPGPKVYRLEEVQPPVTPEEKASRAVAYAVRDLRRGMHRGFGRINRALTSIEQRQQGRRR